LVTAFFANTGGLAFGLALTASVTLQALLSVSSLVTSLSAFSLDAKKKAATNEI
jgi:hypothetical protein